MSTKPDRYGLAVVVLPPVVVTVILLIVALPSTAVGWISLLLLDVAFLAFLGAFRLSSNEAGRVFGLALRYIAWGYLLIALASTFLILGISSFQHWLNDHIELYLLLTLFVTAVYGAFYIGAYLTQRHAGAELAYQRDNLAFGRVATARLDRIKAMSTDPEFVVKVRGVDDAIRFSLVEWTPAARELEGQIIDELSDVQLCLERGDTQTAVQKLAEIRRLAEQRNDAIRLAQ